MAEVLTNFNDGIFTITFNRPHKRNAITSKMMKTIINLLNQTAKDDKVMFVVLTGAGNIYSSGSDFSSDQESDIARVLDTFQDFVKTLIDYPKLIVAVVNGPAIGMACTTLALCDIVFASDEAYFQTPFTQLGLVAEGCSTYTFPRIFGSAKAAKLLYLNEGMQAEEAAMYGFVTEAFMRDEFYFQSYTRLRELATLPLQSLMMTKKLLRGNDREALHVTNREEVKLLSERFLSMDFYNAISNPETFSIIKSKL